MVDADLPNEPQPPEPAPAEPLPAEPLTAELGASWPALAYWAAVQAPPAPGSPPTPEPPTWSRTYELPTARKVVSAGLQLAASSSATIRRASVYIGLLALGAFGPLVLLLLLWLGRLLSEPTIAQTITSNPMLLLYEQPELASAFIYMYALLIIGLVLLIAISIDAQAMAIALLGGIASDQPLRLWEAVMRARQTFWRLVGAGLIVGATTTIVSFVILIPFLRPYDSNQSLSFIASMLGALVVTPFAFASTGIVLGDVGAIEALRRSYRLFRARPAIALVVVLFTLVTATIQTFALGAGADTATRVAEIFHLGVDQGPVAFVVVAALVLAFVVAFGSLTFTIAAIVAAPQVAGFLGLTFHAGGLDRARQPGDAKPETFRWVTRKMIGAMLVVGVFASFGLPNLSTFVPRATGPLHAFFLAAEPKGTVFSPYGPAALVNDAVGDQLAMDRLSADIVTVDYGYLPDVPDWLLDEALSCSDASTICPVGGSRADGFSPDGALIFVQRMRAAPVETALYRREWGVAFRVDGYPYAPAGAAAARFGGASHVFVTRFVNGTRGVAMLVFDGGRFTEEATDARSFWSGSDLVTLVPLSSLGDGWPIRWDAFTFESGSGGADGRDDLRDSAVAALRSFDDPPVYSFFDGFGVP